MAVVQGIREKVHLPLYDSVSVDPEKQLGDVEKSGTLKFFVNVQGKTKLETNLQSASLLPHYNTFEARAMRVVISDLPPKFPEDPTASTDDVNDFDGTISGESATGAEESYTVDAAGTVSVATAANQPLLEGSAELGVDRLVELWQEANDSDDGTAELDAEDDDVTVTGPNGEVSDAGYTFLSQHSAVLTLGIDDIESMLEKLDRKAPPREQLDVNNGSGTIIGKLVYNTVTSLVVGEKVMISMPTWFFPAGAGPYSETGKFTTHGEPTPLATFKFAEPIYIDKQQNFRVEIEVPESDTLKDIQKIYGPLNIWVVLDGYMTRDVQ
jgi:hypothetical protein